MAFFDKVDGHDVIRLSWARRNSLGFANLGDALSPIMVAAISGCRIVNEHFDSPAERMVGVGTLGHAQKNGRLHFWGSGFSRSKEDDEKPYPRPNTEYVVHALRGPLSAEPLRRAGITVPEVYGDPVWMLPKITGRAPVEKKYDLGVILHISELTEETPTGQPLPEFTRYDTSKAGFPIKLINTYTDPTWPAMLALIDEVRACRRIVSTSFHGLVMAETYDIPCAYFALESLGPVMLDPRKEDGPIDHRFRDFLLGQHRTELLSFGQKRDGRTNWTAVIEAVDSMWTPFRWDGRLLYDAFPGPKGAAFDDEVWPLSNEQIASIQF